MKRIALLLTALAALVVLAFVRPDLFKFHSSVPTANSAQVMNSYPGSSLEGYGYVPVRDEMHGNDIVGHVFAQCPSIEQAEACAEDYLDTVTAEFPIIYADTNHRVRTMRGPKVDDGSGRHYMVSVPAGYQYFHGLTEDQRNMLLDTMAEAMAAYDDDRGIDSNTPQKVVLDLKIGKVTAYLAE